MASTGKSVAKFAADNDITKMMLYRVINGCSINQKVRDLIATTIGHSENEIWPEPTKEGK